MRWYMEVINIISSIQQSTVKKEATSLRRDWLNSTFAIRTYEFSPLSRMCRHITKQVEIIHLRFVGLAFPSSGYSPGSRSSMMASGHEPGCLPPHKSKSEKENKNRTLARHVPPAMPLSVPSCSNHACHPRGARFAGWHFIFQRCIRPPSSSHPGHPLPSDPTSSASHLSFPLSSAPFCVAVGRMGRWT